LYCFKAKPSVMKKVLISILAVALFMLVPLFMNNVMADLPPDPGGGGPTGPPVGGGSPIGGGLFVMLSLGIAYGSKKVLDIRKKLMK